MNPKETEEKSKQEFKCAVFMQRSKSHLNLEHLYKQEVNFSSVFTGKQLGQGSGNRTIIGQGNKKWIEARRRREGVRLQKARK